MIVRYYYRSWVCNTLFWIVLVYSLTKNINSIIKTKNIVKEFYSFENSDICQDSLNPYISQNCHKILCWMNFNVSKQKRQSKCKIKIKLKQSHVLRTVSKILATFQLNFAFSQLTIFLQSFSWCPKRLDLQP